LRLVFLAAALLSCPLPSLATAADPAPLKVFPVQGTRNDRYDAFFKRGSGIRLEPSETRRLIAAFEAGLAPIYQDIAVTTAKFNAAVPLSTDDRITLFFRINTWTLSLQVARQKLLEGFGLSKDEIPPMQSQELGVDLDRFIQSGKLDAFRSYEFAYFINGASRQVQTYVREETEILRFGSDIVVNFPSFHFGKNATESIVDVPGEISRTVQRVAQQAGLSTFYAQRVNAMRQVVLQDIDSYSATGLGHSYGVEGQYDMIEPVAKIVLSGESLRRYKARKIPQAAAMADNLVHHEMLHALHQPACRTTRALKRLAWEGDTVGWRELDEAQAVIGSVLATTDNAEAMPYVLFDNSRAYQGSYYYRLPETLFYQPLFRDVATRIGIDSTGASFNSQDSRIKLSLEATPDEVAMAAMAALRKIAEAEALLCKQ
jgi:hypothetical protein